MTTHRHSPIRWLAPALVALAGLSALPAARAADVAVSIGFSQPGVYGRVDIGRYPQPVLVAPQPVYVGPPVYAEPVYLWVPPEQRRDWRRYCYRYGACGAPVYFVQDGWYQQNVVVRYERERQHGWRGRDRDDWQDDDHDHDHDRGRGHGHHDD
ncbi:hypothetical protein [Pelomonas aquatica]|jgi:hypothetical protein|uniref:hypothetical protein n=1 Tax=Pelomonas aquatica TaxID=431058 RepID=UPI00227C4DD1|nr:hypothetical protein [Pelomonas aquatica]MCY4755241.1 hypothetical protein [Pelomonas aquatica]